jgi:hypothetical protein
MRCAHRARQLGRLDVLEQVPCGAGADRREQTLVVEEAGEHDHAASGQPLA